MKRDAESAELDGSADANGSSKQAKVEEVEAEDISPEQATRRDNRIRSGAECPYLDTISRQTLDFDFEKFCSVSLSPVNVYACLVCGKYFQGRGLHTHAFTHAMERDHHVFMKLEDGTVWCLPDGYRVEDRSLDVIRFVLNPKYSAQQVEAMDREARWVRALDGTEYMPGLVGLNNMKANDYVNVAVQIMARVVPIRNFFLLPAAHYPNCRSVLVQRFGELMRKLWNPRNFKGQVSPHEFMRAVMAASNGRFTINAQADPVDFWIWFVNALRADLHAVPSGKGKKSILTKCFQGELEVTTQAGTGKAAQPNAQGQIADVVEKVPFLMLGLDLPPAPLYRDALEKNIIPQVPIFDLLRKFDGQRPVEVPGQGVRRMRITKLPRFLVLQMKRFTRNQFFREKNPTIVNFPVKNLELADIIPVPPGSASKYDLIANVVHEGMPDKGSYHAQVHRQGEDTWYDVQDLRVTDVLPQMVALSETYLQMYELRTDKPSAASRAVK
ncbi:hypothetical protein WJX73_005353 [Symbiochloris irregularis]|uniref:U4/U6.U5 tri-snRNP-associated protein 2 n=1 Tax=Symbiochloris irregularis TaxID=706552 RepID=A0AAW1P8K4_9CHLO